MPPQVTLEELRVGDTVGVEEEQDIAPDGRCAEVASARRTEAGPFLPHHTDGEPVFVRGGSGGNVLLRPVVCHHDLEAGCGHGLGGQAGKRAIEQVDAFVGRDDNPDARRPDRIAVGNLAIIVLGGGTRRGYGHVSTSPTGRSGSR